MFFAKKVTSKAVSYTHLNNKLGMSSNINATNYKFCRFTSWEQNIIHLFRLCRIIRSSMSNGANISCSSRV